MCWRVSDLYWIVVQVNACVVGSMHGASHGCVAAVVSLR